MRVRFFVFSMKASFAMYHIFYENGFWQLEGALPIPVYRIFNAYWFAVLTAWFTSWMRRHSRRLCCEWNEPRFAGMGCQPHQGACSRHIRLPRRNLLSLIPGSCVFTVSSSGKLPIDPLPTNLLACTSKKSVHRMAKKQPRNGQVVQPAAMVEPYSWLLHGYLYESFLFLQFHSEPLDPNLRPRNRTVLF